MAAALRLHNLASIARRAEAEGDHQRNHQHVDFGLSTARIHLGLFYILLYHLQPLAFSLGSTPTPISNEQQAFPILVYFSLTTLSTIGFGDITPVTLQARYAAVAEGITGQFYLAILVARLVGMQMSQAASPVRKTTNPRPRHYKISQRGMTISDICSAS